MATTKGRLGWLLIGIWVVLVLAAAFGLRSGQEPVDCCAPEGLVAATHAFVLAIVTIPVAVVGVYLINREIGLDRVPTVAVLAVAVGVLILPIVVAMAVTVL